MTAKNNASKVTTTMQVLAEDERQARENVTLNGWQVFSLRQLTYREAIAIPLQIGDAPVTYVQIESPPVAQMTDDELINAILGPQVDSDYAGLQPDSAPAAPPAANGTEALMPDSDRLEYHFTLFFDLGAMIPNIYDFEKRQLELLDTGGKFYLFGHTDNIPVAEDNKAYTDNFDLSFKRAEAVKAILEGYGINPANISIVGLGAMYPNVRNNPEQTGTKENRRVEIFGLKQ